LKSGGVYTYTVTIFAAALSESSHSVQISVRGASDQSAMDVKNFTFDKTPPSIAFNNPGQGTSKVSGGLPLSANGVYQILWSGSDGSIQSNWVTGQQPIGGTSDDKNGIVKIYYHLGKLNANPLDGNNNSDRETAYNGASWTDTGLDALSQAANWSGSLYSWAYTENLNSYKGSSTLIEKNVEGVNYAGQSRFYLPLYVKAVDQANNVRIVQYKIFVDPDMDIPRISVTNPAYPTQADKIYLSDTEFTAINAYLNSGTAMVLPGLQAKYNSLAGNIIKDTDAKLAGSFDDGYSLIFDSVNNGYYYKIDNAAEWTKVPVDSS
jgi:hypothetical protein